MSKDEYTEMLDNPMFFLEPLGVWELSELTDSGDITLPVEEAVNDNEE